MENLALRDYPRVHDTLNLRVHDDAMKFANLQRDNSGYNPFDNSNSPFALDLNYLRVCRIKLKQKPLAKPWEINSSLEALFRQSAVEDVYQKVIDRLVRETGFMHQLEELDMIEPLRNNFTAKRINGVRIHWGSSWLLAGIGEFRAIERDIRIRDIRPTPLKTLKSLAQDGIFPPQVIALEHEIIHSTQFKASLLGRFGYFWANFCLGISSLHPNQELDEMHAYTTMQHPIGLGTSPLLVKHVLDAKTPRNNKSFYKNLDPKKATYSTIAAETLDALGLTPIEIGRVVQNAGKWDSNHQIYPGVQEAIDQTAIRYGFTRRDLSILVACHKIEKDLDTIKAMHITQQELLAA